MTLETQADSGDIGRVKIVERAVKLDSCNADEGLAKVLDGLHTGDLVFLTRPDNIKPGSSKAKLVNVSASATAANTATKAQRAKAMVMIGIMVPVAYTYLDSWGKRAARFFECGRHGATALGKRRFIPKFFER